jgi:hypothetical protein
MTSIIVEDVAVRRTVAPGQSRNGLYELRPGDQLSFGRGAPGVDVDLLTPASGVSRRAGHIHAERDFWLLTNASTTSTYVIENLEGAGEHVKVGPGRIEAPIPFELSRLVLPTQSEPYLLNVYAPQHGYLDPRAPSGGAATERPFSLDESAKYFLVLVALCEPRLRDPATVEIPRSDEVAERLSSSTMRMSRSAVDYHIDYLAETKLRIKPPSDGSGARLEHKRESMVAMALRFDLVREDHLALLTVPARGDETSNR